MATSRSSDSIRTKLQPDTPSMSPSLYSIHQSDGSLYSAVGWTIDLAAVLSDHHPRSRGKMKRCARMQNNAMAKRKRRLRMYQQGEGLHGRGPAARLPPWQKSIRSRQTMQSGVTRETKTDGSFGRNNDITTCGRCYRVSTEMWKGAQRVSRGQC